MNNNVAISSGITAAPPHFLSLQADVMLVKNAQNLMQAVTKTMQAAEAAYMKVRGFFSTH